MNCPNVCQAFVVATFGQGRRCVQTQVVTFSLDLVDLICVFTHETNNYMKYGWNLVEACPPSSSQLVLYSCHCDDLLSSVYSDKVLTRQSSLMQIHISLYVKQITGEQTRQVGAELCQDQNKLGGQLRKIHWRRGGSPLPGLRTQDHLLSPPLTDNFCCWLESIYLFEFGAHAIFHNHSGIFLVEK